MTVDSMHYDLKQKLNKIDSQRYRNLEVPEIDWKLNEAQEVFVKIVAEPRLASVVGFEVNQRTIEDIRTIVVDQKKGQGQSITIYDNEDKSYIATLPTDYWFLTNARLYATKGSCTASLDIVPVQHDDLAEQSLFYKSSFFWRTVNIRFNNEGIRIFTAGGDFIPNEICLEYLIQPPLIHNAAAWDEDGYEVDGVVVTGTQDCILPSRTHKEVVDIAVAIIAGDLTLPDYLIKRSKVNMTDNKH